MMEYTVEIIYTKRMIRRALNHFMIERLRWSTPILIIGIGLILMAAFMSGAWSKWFSILFILWAIVTGLIAAVYIARLKSSESFFDKSTNYRASFIFSDNGVKASSDLGTSDMKWNVFDELLKVPDAWLLVYAKSAYVVLPADQLSDEVKNFIESKIQRSEQSRTVPKTG